MATLIYDLKRATDGHLNTSAMRPCARLTNLGLLTNLGQREL